MNENYKMTYLDNAGAIIPPKELLSSICNEMMNTSYANPHSQGTNSYSDKTISMIDQTRLLILSHIHADKDEYDVVFTSNTTSSLSLISQIYPWDDNTCIAYPYNSHTSLLALRAYSSKAICFPSNVLQNHNINITSISNNDSSTIENNKSNQHSSYNLLLIPGECNYSGVKANLNHAGELSCTLGEKSMLQSVKGKYIQPSNTQNIIAINHNNNDNKDGYIKDDDNQRPWLWILDASKLSANTEINISQIPHKPHFICMSFYKIFGYPTGMLCR